MKKLLKMLAILILAFASFSTNANAYVYKDIDNMLSKFYKKIDNALPDIDKRIEKLNKVNKKVNRILIIKKDVLSYKSIQLLGFVKKSLSNHIYLLRRESRMKKDLNKDDILNIFKDYIDINAKDNRNTSDKKEIIFLGPKEVKKGEDFSITFFTKGYDYCSPYGDFIKTSNGNFWPEITKMGTSGKIKLIAIHKTFSNINNIKIGIKCFNKKDNTDSSKKVEIRIIDDNEYRYYRSCGFYNGMFYRDGDEGESSKTKKIDNGTRTNFYKIKCHNGDISKKIDHSHIKCKENYVSENNRCVKESEANKKIVLRGPKEVVEGKEFIIHREFEGYKYCILKENIGESNMKEVYDNGSRKMTARSGIMDFSLKCIGYVNNTYARKRLHIKGIPHTYKSCGYYDGTLYEDGDEGTTSKNEYIEHGIRTNNYSVKCSDGEISLKRQYLFDIKCNNGYKKDNEKCVQEEYYHVRVVLDKKMGVGDNKAIIRFIVNVPDEGIKSVEITKMELGGDFEAKNSKNDSFSFPEEITNSDKWSIYNLNNGERKMTSFTFKVNFKDSNKKPFIVESHVKLDLGKYIKN